MPEPSVTIGETVQYRHVDDLADPSSERVVSAVVDQITADGRVHLTAELGTNKMTVSPVGHSPFKPLHWFKIGVGQKVAARFIVEHRTQAELQEQAMATYVRLLNAETEEPGDIDKLTDAARTLGRTPADLSADHAAVQNAKALVAELHSLAGCDVVAAAVNAMYARHYEAVQSEIKRIEKRHRSLGSVQDNANQLRFAFEGAMKRLVELKHANPVLAPIALPDAALAQQAGVLPESVLPTLASWLAGYVAVLPSPLANSSTPLPPPAW